jgi:hypothetical protein
MSGARFRPVTPMKAHATSSMRRLAGRAEQRHPGMHVHVHVRDAARALEAGNAAGAIRHLNAAMYSLTPQSLRRHGLTTDQEYTDAKAHMDQIHRHVLLIRDIQDTEARNNQVMQAARDRMAPPQPPPHLQPGPPPQFIGTSRQPESGRALNAPNSVPSGRPDGTARGPAAPVTTAAGHPSQLAGDWHPVIELVGPKGYIHGWIKVDAGQGFGAGLEPGSFEHINAINDLADQAGHLTGDPGHSSPTMQNALHNLARSVAMRDMKGARIHLDSAKWANQHEAGGLWTRDLANLESQLGRVPKQATGFRSRRVSPLSPRGQHPGRYVSASGIVADPTKNALHIPSYAIAAAVEEIWPLAIELSAQTGALATTPHPFGKPGGPGLWDVKGMELPPYIQNIAHALLRTGRAKTVGQAIAMAKAATSRWEHGKNTTPEVRAASAVTNADWQAKRARAHASH